MTRKSTINRQCFFCILTCYNIDMTSTADQFDAWFDDDHGTASPDDFEMEDDVDDLDIPSWANVTAEE